MAREIKNFKNGTEAVKNALKNPGTFWKSFINGKGSKIDNWSAFFMVVVAIGIDICQALAGLLDGGYISAPISILIQLGVYSLWFKLKGVSYWGTRKIASKAVTSGIEVIGGWIPWLSTIIPATTIMVVAAIGLTRIEEAGDSTKKTPESKQEKEEQGIRTPKRESNKIEYRRAA